MITLTISFEIDFYPLLIVMATAWFIPMLMSYFGMQKVPSVIIEIIAGFIIGRTILFNYPAADMQSLDFLALSGFLFLMFYSGFEIDLQGLVNTLPKRKITVSRFLKNPLLVGLVMFLITLALSYMGTLWLNSIIEIQNNWYFSLILVTTSVGVILPVLKTRGELASRYGQMVLLAAAVADLLSIILFTFSAFIIRHGFQIEIFLVIVLFFIFILFRSLGIRLSKVTLFKRLTYELSHATSQIKVRGTVLLILFFVTLAQYLGEEVMLLGAFLSGLLLSSFIHKEKSVLLLQLEGIGYGFFIPIFFIMVGVNFDPSALEQFDSALYVFLGLLVLILFAVKIIPSFLWLRLFKFRKALAGGILLSSRLSLIIAASKIGVDLEIISPGINACFIIMAIVTCLLSPTLYNVVNPKSELTGEKTIIIGGSSTGVLLARRLKMQNKYSVIIEKDMQRYNELRKKGLNVMLGSGTNRELIKRLNIQPSDFVVVLTGDDKTNFKVAKLLREYCAHERIISKSMDSKIEEKLSSLEVESLDIIRIVASTIENIILRPNTYRALSETLEHFILEETEVTNPEFIGKQLKDVPFHKDSYLMLIRRKDKMHIPHGDTYLRKGDKAIIFGTETAIVDAKYKLSP